MSSSRGTTLRIGAVAYDSKVVTIWEGFQQYFAKRGVLIDYRIGDIVSPRLPLEEPLKNVVAHFAACVRQGTRPLTDGHAGLRLVRILDLAHRSIKANGNRLTFREDLGGAPATPSLRAA